MTEIKPVKFILRTGAQTNKSDEELCNAVIESEGVCDRNNCCEKLQINESTFSRAAAVACRDIHSVFDKTSEQHHSDHSTDSMNPKYVERIVISVTELPRYGYGTDNSGSNPYRQSRHWTYETRTRSNRDHPGVRACGSRRHEQFKSRAQENPDSVSRVDEPPVSYWSKSNELFNDDARQTRSPLKQQTSSSGNSTDWTEQRIVQLNRTPRESAFGKGTFRAVSLDRPR